MNEADKVCVCVCVCVCVFVRERVGWGESPTIIEGQQQLSASQLGDRRVAGSCLTWTSQYKGGLVAGNLLCQL